MNNELLLEKAKELRILIFGILTSIVLVGVFFVRTGPTETLKVRHTEMYREVELLLSNQRNGTNLEDNLETIKSYTDYMDDRFISQNLADIHDVFYTLERESGVALESFQRPEMISEPIIPKGSDLEYQPLSMAVTISGTFKNVLKFVHALENSPLLYRYNGLNVSNKASASGNQAVSLTLKLELLSLNE